MDEQCRGQACRLHHLHLQDTSVQSNLGNAAWYWALSGGSYSPQVDQHQLSGTSQSMLAGLCVWMQQHNLTSMGPPKRFGSLCREEAWHQLRETSSCQLDRSAFWYARTCLIRYNIHFNYNTPQNVYILCRSQRGPAIRQGAAAQPGACHVFLYGHLQLRYPAPTVHTQHRLSSKLCTCSAVRQSCAACNQCYSRSRLCKQLSTCSAYLSKLTVHRTAEQLPIKLAMVKSLAAATCLVLPVTSALSTQHIITQMTNLAHWSTDTATLGRRSHK